MSVKEDSWAEQPIQIEQPAETLQTKIAPPPTELPGVKKPNDELKALDEQIKMLKDAAAAYAPESAEDKRKRERKERAKKIIAASFDGISAMGNLYFASQGGLNTFNPGSGAIASTMGAIGKAADERRANREQYERYALRAGELEERRAATVRELEAAAEKRRLQRAEEERAAEEHEWKRVLQPDVAERQRAEADYYRNRATVSGYEAKSAEEYYGNRADVEGERVRTERSKQARNYRPPQPRSGVAKTVTVTDRNGNIVRTTTTVPDASSGQQAGQSGQKPTGLKGKWKK